MLRRSRTRFFGSLALVAIALQMVVSFGHAHAGVAQSAGIEAAAFVCLDANAGAIEAPCRAPADHDGHEATCLICLAASQAAAIVLPETPEIAWPGLTVAAFKTLPSAPVITGTGVANFYARGPPRA